MKCFNCGAWLTEDTKFCSYCGVKIPEQEVNFEKPRATPNFSSSSRTTSRHIVANKKTNSKSGVFILVGFALLLVIIAVTLLLGRGVSGDSSTDTRLVANQTFDDIIAVVSSDTTIEVGTEYAYMADEWNVYIAKAVSDSVIKIECWDKTSQLSKTMEFSSDLGSFRIGDEENGFSWIDECHTAFTFVIQDKSNSEIKNPTAVVFTINISDSDTDKGTDYNKNIACYSYENDSWHTYRAIPLTDTLIKIECWYRTIAGFFSSHRFGWDVGVIDTENTNTDFAWGDANHTAFTITMTDPQNGSYWEEEKLTSFILENEGYKYFDVSSYLSLSSHDGDSRFEKDGFDSATNEVYELAGYTVEIPEYWISENKIDGGFQCYAETNGKVAMLQVTAQAESDKNYSVTFDGLMDDNDNMIAMVEATAFEEVTNYEVIDTGNVKGILYEGIVKDEDSGLAGYGAWFTFASESDRTWCTLIMMQTNNTEYE